MTQWICCHLGAREHYAIPRALHRDGRLRALITDVWVPPGSGLAVLTPRSLKRLGERYHPDLAAADVRAFSTSFLVHEASSRLLGRRNWAAIMARNSWFQARALRALRERGDAAPMTVFAHSYSALELFREARSRGWKTVMGQIDPGVEHFRMTAAIESRRPDFASMFAPPPAKYLDDWRAECELADAIIVNSDWSREALVRAGVSPRKLRIIPLTYEPEFDAAGWRREYPRQFTAARPLRALFVGTAVAMKGVPELLEAVASLDDIPVELRLVGERAMRVPDRYASHPRIIWQGPVSRRDVMEYYRASDILVFPSHSDGFGMAQVEAQAWGLPIVASRFCGAVVRDGVNGVMLDEVSAPSIAGALRQAAANPSWLAGLSSHSRVDSVGLGQLSESLAALAS